MLIYQYIQFAAVGLLWGGTNPLIKRGSEGIDAIKTNTKHLRFIDEILFLITRWQYVVPFLANQSGSLLYVYALQNAELSIAVPIANSCTFLFTALMAILLGEQVPNIKSFIGMIMIAIGVAICLVSKMWNKYDFK